MNVSSLLPLSIQLKPFLFLFHIYVKIHFVFYSNAFGVVAYTFGFSLFLLPKIWIIFEFSAERREEARRKKKHAYTSSEKIIERA